MLSVRYVSSGFSEIFGTQLFLAIGKEKYQTIATVIAAVINLTLNYFLIQIYGATGAAIATAICEISVTLILAVLAYRMHIVSFRKIVFSSWKYILAAAVMFVPIFFMQRWLGNAIWTFIVIMLVGIAVYFLMLVLLRDRFFMNNVKNLFELLKSKNVFRKQRKNLLNKAESDKTFHQESKLDNLPPNEK